MYQWIKDRIKILLSDYKTKKYIKASIKDKEKNIGNKKIKKIKIPPEKKSKKIW